MSWLHDLFINEAKPALERHSGGSTSGGSSGEAPINRLNAFLIGDVEEITEDDLNGVTSLNNSAFASKPSLKKVTIPASVTTIGESALKDCGSLESIHVIFGGKEKSFGGNLTDNSKHVTSVYIDDIDKLCKSRFGLFGNSLFYLDTTGDAMYTDLYLNGKIVKELDIKTYGTYCNFQGCKSVETVRISASGTYGTLYNIGNSMFSRCFNLKTVEICEGVRQVQSNAFLGCKNLSDVTFPTTLTALDGFSGCTSLESVYIPARSIVTSLQMSGVFKDCTSLKTVVIEHEGFTCTNSTSPFKGCTALENFSITKFKLSNNNFKLSDSPLLTVESMLSILNAAEDNAGGTTYTIYFGATNLAKLTEDQMAIAYDKNINLA